MLNELNIGMTGKLTNDSQWDYYELIRDSLECEPSLRCISGKCLTKEKLCDGKFDCGDPQDRTDESGCPVQANVKVRLKGGSSPNQGYVEVKAFDHAFGGIDNQ